ncbi:SART-1 family domain-containing protein [Phthorimaea operculella]|nr:SART-1 family domain-containing protein [Phthorimaea operculella]
MVFAASRADAGRRGEAAGVAAHAGTPHRVRVPRRGRDQHQVQETKETGVEASWALLTDATLALLGGAIIPPTQILLATCGKMRKKAKEEPIDVDDYDAGAAPLLTDDTEVKPELLKTELAVDDEEVEPDSELQLALARARRMRQQDESRPHLPKVEELLERVKEEEQDEDMEQSTEGAMVLDATAEFCRTLGDIPTYGLAGNRDHKQEMLDFERDMELEPEQPAEPGTSGAWSRVDIEAEQPPDLLARAGATGLAAEPALEIFGAITISQIFASRDCLVRLLEQSRHSYCNNVSLCRSRRSGRAAVGAEQGVPGTRGGHAAAPRGAQPPANRQELLHRGQELRVSASPTTPFISSGEDDKYGRRERGHGGGGGGPLVEFREKAGFRPNIKAGIHYDYETFLGPISETLQIQKFSIKCFQCEKASSLGTFREHYPETLYRNSTLRHRPTGLRGRRRTAAVPQGGVPLPQPQVPRQGARQEQAGEAHQEASTGRGESSLSSHHYHFCPPLNVELPQGMARGTISSFCHPITTSCSPLVIADEEDELDGHPAQHAADATRQAARDSITLHRAQWCCQRQRQARPRQLDHSPLVKVKCFVILKYTGSNRKEPKGGQGTHETEQLSYGTCVEK